MSHPAQSSPDAEGPKHRACDECRGRKLACTKEAAGCSRCKRDGVRCVYSRQKQMGRPRKAKRPMDAPHGHVQDVRPVHQQYPVIMPANDVAMDLDLDLAFFDMNEINFLDLLGPNSLGTEIIEEPAPAQPKQVEPQPRPPGPWLIDQFSHEIDFSHPTEPQSLSSQHLEEFTLEDAVKIMSADLPETLPALSPQQSSSDSSDHSSPSDPAQSTICSCLASLYLALNSLQHLPKDVPSAIHVARSASKTAHNTIVCPVCSTPPLDPADPTCRPPIQSLQNMMMLGALLPSLCNAYKTILSLVDEEARAADLASRQLTFGLASYGGLWGGLGAVDSSFCDGAAEGVEGRALEPAMWRLAVRALLKVDVYGLSDCAPLVAGGGRMWQLGLKDIIRMMEERSRARHEEIDRLVAAGLLRMDGSCGGEYVPLNLGSGEKPTCFRIIDVAKRSMQSLDIP